MLSIAGLLPDGTFSFNNNEVIRPVHFTNVALKLASRPMRMLHVDLVLKQLRRIKWLLDDA